MATFPIIAEIRQAPGKGGKLTVRAFVQGSSEDITREIIYVTLQSAFKNKQWLVKLSAGDRWQRIPANTPPSKLKDYVQAAPSRAKSAPDHAPMPVQGELDRKKAQELAAKDPLLQMIHSSPSKRPNTLFCNDLTWKLICRNIVRGRNIMLTGPTGTGKSQTAFAAAKAMDRELFYINLGSTQDPRGALVGNTHFSKDSGTFFNQSAFVTAIQTPNTVVVLDELSRAHPEAANILMTVLDPDQRYLRLDEQVGTPTIKVDPTVSFIATANIGAEYTATRVLDRALIDRFSIIEIPFLSAAEERALIDMRYPALTDKQSENLAAIAASTRAEITANNPKITTPLSTRSVLEMASLLADGFTLTDCAEVAIYPLYSQEGGIQSERTFIKQLVQKYVNDGTADTLINAQSPVDRAIQW